MACRLGAVAEALPGVTAQHRGTCLNCQATDARDRMLRRELASLAGPVTAPVALVPAVISALDNGGAREAAAGVSLPAAVAAGGAVVGAGILAVLLKHRLVSH